MKMYFDSENPSKLYMKFGNDLQIDTDYTCDDIGNSKLTSGEILTINLQKINK